MNFILEFMIPSKVGWKVTNNGFVTFQPTLERITRFNLVIVELN